MALSRQFSGLTQGHEGGLELIGHGPAQNKPARVNTGHFINLNAFVAPDQIIHHALYAFGVGQKCCDVAELNACLGKTRHRTNA